MARRFAVHIGSAHRASAASELSAIEKSCVGLYSIPGGGPVWDSDVKRIPAKSWRQRPHTQPGEGGAESEIEAQGFRQTLAILFVAPSNSELVGRLKDRDLNELLDSLVNGEPSPPEDPAEDSPHGRREDVAELIERGTVARGT